MILNVIHFYQDVLVMDLNVSHRKIVLVFMAQLDLVHYSMQLINHAKESIIK